MCGRPPDSKPHGSQPAASQRAKYMFHPLRLPPLVSSGTAWICSGPFEEARYHKHKLSTTLKLSTTRHGPFAATPPAQCERGRGVAGVAGSHCSLPAWPFPPGCSLVAMGVLMGWAPHQQGAALDAKKHPCLSRYSFWNPLVRDMHCAQDRSSIGRMVRLKHFQM